LRNAIGTLSSQHAQEVSTNFSMKVGMHASMNPAPKRIRKTSESSRPCGKATTAYTAALADTRALIKNPALDTGSRPRHGTTDLRAAGEHPAALSSTTKSRKTPTERF
jgi:hypothetical protein